MKRLWCWTIALFALSAMPPARAAVGDVNILKEQIISGIWVKGMARWGDGLILLMGEGGYSLWSRAEGLSEPREFADLHPEEEVAALLQGPDGPWALLFTWAEDAEEGVRLVKTVRACPVSLEGDELRFLAGVALDWPAHDEERPDGPILWPFADESMLVLLREDRILAFELASGARREIALALAEPDEEIHGLTGYGSGFALAATFSPGKGAASFYGIDLGTGESKRIHAAKNADGAPGGLAYDRGADLLYYVYEGALLQAEGLKAKSLQEVNTIALHSNGIIAALVLEDGSYVAASSTNVLLRNTDPEARAAATLRVHTGFYTAPTRAADQFMARNPDVDVILVNEVPDPVAAMLNRSDAVDIYTFSVHSREYAALYERGYLAALSDSAALMEYANALYPALREASAKDSALLAIPLFASAEAWTCSPEPLARLGLNEADIPRTWAGFLGFLRELPGLIEETNIVPIPKQSGAAAREAVLMDLIEDYALYMVETTGALSFDTPLFRDLIAAFEQVDFVPLTFERSWRDSAEEDSYDGLLSLGKHGGINCAAFEPGSPLPIPLAMEEGAAPMIRWHVGVAVMNPYSANKAAAFRYLEAVAEEVDMAARIGMNPDLNTPIENPEYEAMLDHYGEDIAAHEDLLAQVLDGFDLSPALTRDEEERALEEAIHQIEEEMEEYRAQMRYRVSPESIQGYRRFAEYFVVQTYPGIDLADGGDEFQKQISMYLDGLNDAEAFIRNIEAMVRMMIREGY